MVICAIQIMVIAQHEVVRVNRIWPVDEIVHKVRNFE